jgi:hypothetical protein
LKLNFPPIGAATASPLSADFAVMLVGIAARQAASPTAAMAHDEEMADSAEEKLLAPQHGAFNRAVADDLKRWKDGSTGQTET